MSHIERVKEVRAIVEPHYNCGQIGRASCRERVSMFM